MNDCRTTAEKRLLTGALVCALLLIAIYFVFVGTPWGHQFDDDAFLGRKTLSRRFITLDSGILDLVRKSTLLVASLVTLAIAVVRRSTFVGIVAVSAFGCAVVGAEVLKSVLPWRALVPKDAMLESGFQTNTYPSGHATIATSLALGLLLVSASRWRPWLVVAGGCLSATFATGVLFVGWHRPSDALGALAWSGLCMSVAAVLVIRLRSRPGDAFSHRGQGALGSLILGPLMAIGSCLMCAAIARPLADLAFFGLTGVITMGAFTLIAWYGWQLRAIN